MILDVEEKKICEKLKKKKQKYVQNEYNVIDTTLRENNDSPHNILISACDSFSLDSCSLHSYSEKSSINNICLESASQGSSFAEEPENISPSQQESDNEDFIKNTPDRDIDKINIVSITQLGYGSKMSVWWLL